MNQEAVFDFALPQWYRVHLTSRALGGSALRMRALRVGLVAVGLLVFLPQGFHRLPSRSRLPVRQHAQNRLHQGHPGLNLPPYSSKRLHHLHPAGTRI